MSEVEETHFDIGQPIPNDENILGENGQPLNPEDVWKLALQESQDGKVRTSDGREIRRAQALRLAMDKDYEILAVQLEKGVTQNTIRFFDFLARIHKYSPGNQDLIFKQAPWATYVQSFSAWSRGGYKLKSRDQGIQPIKILKPKPYMRIVTKDENGEVIEEAVKSAFYEIAIVYDISDVDERYKKPPAFWTPLEGNADHLTARLTEVLEAEGIPVEYRYLPEVPGARGASHLGRISIRPDLDSVNRFFVLSHEAGHEWIHKDTNLRYNLPQAVKECQAEVFAYMVCSHFGIRYPFAADYLRTYGTTKEILKANLKITQAIVHEAITKMEGPYNLYAEFEYDPTKEDALRRDYKRGEGNKRKRSGKRT